MAKKEAKEKRSSKILANIRIIHPDNGAHPTLVKKLTFGQRASDIVTSMAGSWAFILSLLFCLAVWMVLNAAMWIRHWDPYPFILLNFVLSTLAALQAPIILMSQNRMAERDRINAKYDYQVNRKAEREIQNMQKDLDEIKAMIIKIKR